ncbi:MAG TPA: branched-chain amino acid ABC transporter permease [Acidimicrobiales bacterium]|nr:branched-chain amino acid ABC transporter permease [Acidimicrobiales bacterium]
MSAPPAGLVPGLAPGALPARARRAEVRRSARPAGYLAVGAAAAVVLLALMPLIISQSGLSVLVSFFILLTMATMWNLLAGYGGLVSIGQQTFVGLAGYGIVVFAGAGLNPLASIPLAALVAAAIALPISYLVFRLRGGYFAIATWVVASAAELVVSSNTSLGGGTGHPVPGLSSLSPDTFGDVTYWCSLAVGLLALAAAYAILRSRLGLVLAAVRDDEVAAASSGARVTAARRIVFLVAALGCGAAGALLAVSQLQVQPTSIFGITWAAEMIFVTMIGGIGTLEGPIVGTVLFFVLQQNLANEGAWYLIILGSVAVVVAIWAPKGIWGYVSRRLNFQVFPVGYLLSRTEETR